MLRYVAYLLARALVLGAKGVDVCCRTFGLGVWTISMNKVLGGLTPQAKLEAQTEPFVTPLRHLVTGFARTKTMPLVERIFELKSIQMNIQTRMDIKNAIREMPDITQVHLEKSVFDYPILQNCACQ